MLLLGHKSLPLITQLLFRTFIILYKAYFISTKLGWNTFSTTVNGFACLRPNIKASSLSSVPLVFNFNDIKYKLRFIVYYNCWKHKECKIDRIYSYGTFTAISHGPLTLPMVDLYLFFSIVYFHPTDVETRVSY